MPFEFATAGRIIFGAGSLQKIKPMLEKGNSRVFVVIGNSPERAAPILEILAELKIHHEIFRIAGEPTTDIALDGVARARRMDATMVIGFGGGSVLDAGKVIAALLTNSGDLFDYLEVIGKGRSIDHPPALYIAIPTTAGTGAEVTRNAVLSSPQHRVKVSMRSPLMLPALALIDPELTYSMPPDVTASTGLDALTQLMEAVTSRNANPLTDNICREGIQRAARALRTAYLNGQDASAREDMALASLFGGMALANAGLGAVHGFAGPLGGMFAAPHGAICACLLPHVIEANIRAIEARQPESPALDRYLELAQQLTGSARLPDLVQWLTRLCADLKIPTLSDLGMTSGDISEVVSKSQNSSSMKGNPISLTRGELTLILEQSI
ncbi:MAG: iron-containing alcohol dehydrogenase [Candidatus Zhuqueibacterota bacterium]